MMTYDRTKLKYHDRQEEVWVVTQSQTGQQHDIIGVGVSELATPDLPGLDKSRPFISTKTILHRPSLAPIYGGPTLLEALWNEMDAIMERLMTGTDNEDGGDRYRAEELAWVLAIVTNAYDPSVDRIREETMARWNRLNGEMDAQEEALDPDQDDVNTRPEGADQ